MVERFRARKSRPSMVRTLWQVPKCAGLHLAGIAVVAAWLMAGRMEPASEPPAAAETTLGLADTAVGVSDTAVQTAESAAALAAYSVSIELAAPATGAPPSPAAPVTAPVREYEVRSGDTIKGIAQGFGLPAQALLWSNDLPNPDLVHPGQRLLVPPGAGLLHRVRAGDTIWAIAVYYQAHIHEIIAWNTIATADIIQPGQVLFVPGGVRPQPKPAPAPPAPQPADATPSVPDSVQAPATEPQLAAAAIGQVALEPTPTPLPGSPREAFIAWIAPKAQESQRRLGIPASVTIAQAILESGWGRSRLSREAHNYFGIKGSSRPGPAGVVWMYTWEVIRGQNVMRREPFRAYHTAAESFEDHARFFHENPRYARALAVRDDPRSFAREISRAGFATDPAYASKLIALMDQHNLYRFDR